MQSSMERKKLRKVMHGESTGASMGSAKCAAGLAAIVLIAMSSYGQSIGRGPARTVETAAADRVHQSAQEQRKQIFEERRRRFHGGAGQRSIASETVKPPNQSPVVMR